MPWFDDFLQSRGIVGDPPPKRPKRAAADGTYVAPPQLPELPTIGPLQPQNMAAGGGIDRSRDAYQPLPVEDQGVLGSGEGQSLFDVLPGVGSARGVKAAADVAKQSLPLGLLMGGLSVLPEGGALAGKVGKAIGKELPFLGKPMAAIRVHVPGEAEPRLFTGAIHPTARLDAEDQLGDLLDDNFEPRFQIDEGFVVGPDQTWLSRQEGLDYAKRHKLLNGNPRTQEAIKRSKQLKAEGLKGDDGYTAADSLASLPERIVAAAIRDPETGKIYRGPVHALAAETADADDVLERLNHQLNIESDLDQSNSHVGYVTDRDRFVGRAEASEIAKKQKQLKPLSDLQQKWGVDDHQLTSERFKKGELEEGGPLADSLAVGGARDLAGLIGKDHNPSVLDVVRGMVRNDPMPRITSVDADKASHMAKVFESLPKHDPAAGSAYDALNREVEQQYKAIQDAGYKIEFTDADPYANSAEMMKDVRENKRLKVYKTADDQAHPYMTPEQNNRFRAVHDWIAHAGPGNQFGPIGEENAYRMHAATLSPEAQRALATETRGQNSWMNFGPNSHLPVKERPFAEQKAALWPEDLLGDYDKMPPTVPSVLFHGTPDDFQGFTRRKIGNRDVGIHFGTEEQAKERLSWKDAPGGRLLRASVDMKKPFRMNDLGHWSLDNVKYALSKQFPEAESLRSLAQVRTFLRSKGYDGIVYKNTGEVPGLGALTKDSRAVGEKMRGLKYGSPEHSELQTQLLDIESKRSKMMDEGGGDSYIAFGPEQVSVLPEPQLEAPAIISRDKWTPTERGVFDRKAPELQGTAEPDPRMFANMPRGKASPLAEAISQSPVVEGGLMDDALEGLERGGREWYELGPLWQYFEENKGPFTFRDWLHASGAGSVQNPTHNELATASALLFGKKRGIDWEMVKKIQQNMHPQEKNLWLGEDISKIFNRASDEGILLPESPSASTRKVPWYTQGKFGGSRRSLPALDTHERRRITQLAAQDPNIRRLLEVLQVRDKKAPNGLRPFRMEGTNADVIPISNALDYEALAQPYVRGGNLLDLPSSQAFQAGRWLGGGQHTGLMSAPFGDYIQTLEDGLLYTARLRGLDESPAGLRRLANSIFSGDEMFAPVYSRKGGFPGVTGH